MSELGTRTIGGGWLGTYADTSALQRESPVRFEATITEPDSEGTFTGSILDDDGLGEADMRGEQSGLGVRFSKVFRGRGQTVISYEGTLAEDGRTMQGTWQTPGSAHGVWDAHRSWSENGVSSSEEMTEEFTEGWDRPRVREIVRLG